MKYEIIYDVDNVEHDYEDIINDVISDEIRKRKKDVVTLIKDILECNVDPSDREKIFFLIEKVTEVRIQVDDKGRHVYPKLWSSSNKAIINYLLRRYYPISDDQIIEQFIEANTYDSSYEYELSNPKTKLLKK